SEFRDLVLGVRYNGKEITAGFRLPKGSSVTLIVGQSSSEGVLLIPSIKGLFLDEAIDLAHSKSLNIGDVHYDVTPPNQEEAKYYQVYKQEPITGSTASVGKKITIWMTTDPTLIEAPEDIVLPKDSLKTEY
ncbi:MAG: PASTA domain-containing protein, partial [Bacteroidales bacterium]|nr:PASTA domain-containing protein [Bacteroidales bacterium]